MGEAEEFASTMAMARLAGIRVETVEVYREIWRRAVGFRVVLEHLPGPDDIPAPHQPVSTARARALPADHDVVLIQRKLQDLHGDLGVLREKLGELAAAEVAGSMVKPT